MLYAAGRFADDFPSEEAVGDLIRATPVMSARPVPYMPTDRYGARARPNYVAIALILIVHAILLGALIQVRNHIQRKDAAKLTVVNLAPPPPPPPAAQAPPPPPSTPAVAAPPPIVHTPVPPVQSIQTTPVPVPLPAPAPAPSVAPAALPPPFVAPIAAPSIVQAGDLGTQMVAGKPPRYPVESRRKREQGTVILTLTLGVDGAVDSIAISQSSGFARLDDAARDAVKGWRWKPIIRNGQPMRVKGVVEIPFVLRADA